MGIEASACAHNRHCIALHYSRPWSRVEAYMELTAVCAFGAHKQRTQNNLCRPTVCAKIQLLYFWTVCCFIENVHAQYNTYCIFTITTFLSYSRLNDWSWRVQYIYDRVVLTRCVHRTKPSSDRPSAGTSVNPLLSPSGHIVSFWRHRRWTL